MENCLFFEAKYGAHLTFSNIPYEDFIFIFFAILLENSILFMSEHAFLLTATVFKLLIF